MPDYDKYDSRVILSRRDRAEIRRRREKREKHGRRSKATTPLVKTIAMAIPIIALAVAAIYGLSKADLPGLSKKALNRVSQVQLSLPHKNRMPAGSISQNKSASETETKEVSNSCLIVGATGVPGREEAAGVFLLVLNESNDELNAVAIPPDVFINIPGYGYDKLAVALRIGGMKGTVSAVKNFLSAPIDHYVKIRNQDFEELAASEGFSEMIARAQETDLASKGRIDLAYKLSKVDSSRIEVVDLPAKKLEMGADTYYQVQEAQTRFLVQRIYNQKANKSGPATRVLVLNGCGQPGVTGPIQEKLIDSGYKVEESKNADRFSYDVTQIITYMDSTEQAIKIKRVLGCGTIIQKKAPQELIDIIIVVGKDLSPGT